MRIVVDEDRVREENGTLTGEAPCIELRGVSVDFPTPTGATNRALRDIDFRVEEGEIVCLLGPSGCGKSTILNLIAGLVSPAAGEVYCNGSNVRNVNTNVGYITQSPNLLPWRSLKDNIRIGLEIDRIGRDQQELRVAQALELLGLTGYEDLYPRQLSGGMQSRASLARTLVTNRSILLMDEPFSALDAQRRTRLQSEVQRLWMRERKTIIFVTHDIDEALILGGRVIVFGPGPSSRILGEYSIDLPYPRDVAAVRNHQAYGQLWSRLWDDLGSVGADVD